MTLTHINSMTYKFKVNCLLILSLKLFYYYLGFKKIRINIEFNRESLKGKYKGLISLESAFWAFLVYVLKVV